jgi:hypothetical protein
MGKQHGNDAEKERGRPEQFHQTNIIHSSYIFINHQLILFVNHMFFSCLDECAMGLAAPG